MSALLVYAHIEKNESEPAHLARVPRVRVAQIIMDHLAHGWDAEEIHRQYPYMTLSEAHMALAYYFDHQQEIEQEIEQELQQVQKDQANARPSPFVHRMKSKGLL